MVTLCTTSTNLKTFAFYLRLYLRVLCYSQNRDYFPRLFFTRQAEWVLLKHELKLKYNIEEQLQSAVFWCFMFKKSRSQLIFYSFLSLSLSLSVYLSVFYLINYHP